jgi:hypothetical protein
MAGAKFMGCPEGHATLQMPVFMGWSAKGGAKER